MKYMMLMNTPRGTGDYRISEWSPEDFRAHIKFMMNLNTEIKASGEFVDAQGLAPPSDARLVRAGSKGEPITDGPFAESKEFLAGFWIIDVENAARAYELAAKASSAPGPGGEPLRMPIEVRRVMDAPPIEA